MGRFTSTCILVLFASGLYQGVLAKKPRIITPSQEDNVIYIREGCELRIECEGRGKLRFWPEVIDGHNPTKSKTYIDDGTRRTVFLRKETTTADTGWYACAEEGTIVINDEYTTDHQDENIAWIYVYVENSFQAFAVERDNVAITVRADGNAVIPCRTTSPRHDVTLFLNYVADQVFPGWTYDPKIGFRKDTVGVFEAGYYECGINGVSDGFRQSFILTVNDFGTELPMPVIDKKPLQYVVWGKNLTLKCSIKVPIGLRLDLTWTAPISISQKRLVVSEYTDYDTSIQITNLTVVNATKDDGGKYLCEVRDLSDNRTENVFQNIEIRDPNIPSINVTADGEKFSIDVKEGTSVKWKLTIMAYPDDLKWEWFNPSGHKILDSKVGSTSSYNHTQEEYSHFFGIRNVDAGDNGHYELKLSAGNFSKTVPLILSVKGRPKLVEMMRDTPEYGVGQHANFTCTARGSPLPTITWDFVEYSDSASSGNYEKKHVSLQFEKDNNISDVTSRVEIVTNAAGRLTCTACSDKNCTNGTLPTSTTDPNEHFGLSGPQLAATVGDNVTLTCHVSLENYKDKLRWEFSGSSALPMAERRKDTTNKKYVSELTLVDVKMSAHGTYSCVAETNTNKTDRKIHDLKIEEASPPDILETLYMNDSTISVTPKQPIALACYAKGAPKPKIFWYMNGEQLEKSSQYSFMDGGASLRIQHFYLTDSGRYSCLAENRLGVAERAMKIQVEGSSPSANVTSISIICTLIVIIIIVITFMGYRVRREKQLRKELTDAGLTHFVEGAVESLNPDLPVDDQAELLPYDKKWEFPRENLKLGKQLGSGAFGVVMKAEAKGICVEDEVTTVAVKMVRRTAEPSYMKALASELKIMIHLGRHINVVNLLGACTKTILTKRELLVIVEYCHFGNLHHYLQHHRNNFIDQIDPSTQKIDPDIGLELLNARSSVVSQNKSIYDRVLSYTASPSVKSSYSNNSVELVNYRPDLGYQGEVNMFPDGGLSNNSVQPGWRSNYRGDYKDQNLKPICTQDLLCWAWQVSRGMEYLSSRNVLHGDLAARNILLAEDNIVKICDFGLAKNMYKDKNYKKKGDTPLPIKWMAVESIRDRIFSTHSDVWSFGIVLWEFFTLARIPYPGMEAERQYDRLMEGHRLEKPEYATEEIYNFMLDCWQAEPTSRPSFPDLVNKLGTLLNERVKTRYFDLNTPYANMNAIALQNGQNDYLTMMSSPNHVYCNTPNLEVDPATGYVPMSRILKSPDAGPSALSPKFTKTHFDFVLDNAKPDSDSENCTESAPMLEDADRYPGPVGTQQVAKPSSDKNLELKDDGYCRIAESPPYSNLNSGNNSGNKSEIKDRDDHVIDMLQHDKESPKIEYHTTKSFTNPSYVVMSNNRVK